jgi:hypothetical protein
MVKLAQVQTSFSQTINRHVAERDKHICFPLEPHFSGKSNIHLVYF